MAKKTRSRKSTPAPSPAATPPAPNRKHTNDLLEEDIARFHRDAQVSTGQLSMVELVKCFGEMDRTFLRLTAMVHADPGQLIALSRSWSTFAAGAKRRREELYAMEVRGALRGHVVARAAPEWDWSKADLGPPRTIDLAPEDPWKPGEAGEMLTRAMRERVLPDDAGATTRADDLVATSIGPTGAERPASARGQIDLTIYTLSTEGLLEALAQVGINKSHGWIYGHKKQLGGQRLNGRGDLRFKPSAVDVAKRLLGVCPPIAVDTLKQAREFS